MPASALGGILACPRCHTPLAVPEEPEAPVCVCGARYGWDSGALDLTPVPPPPGLVADRWALWEQLQANGATAYDAEPISSLSVGDRVDARLFGAFADLRGRVLDVGCGPQERPSYVPDTPGVELVGIDPLRGVPTRDFAFVRGLGEYLPFAAGSFDRVLLGTSIDHLLDPARALAEAERVLTPDGKVVIWFALPWRGRLPVRVEALARRALELARTVRGRSTSGTPAAMAVELATPEGAIDAFHFGYPDLAQVESWVTAAGLRVAERARLSEPTLSVFLSAVRR